MGCTTLLPAGVASWKASCPGCLVLSDIQPDNSRVPSFHCILFVQSAIFLFVEHPYDVGDMLCMPPGNTLARVKKVCQAANHPSSHHGLGWLGVVNEPLIGTCHAACGAVGAPCRHNALAPYTLHHSGVHPSTPRAPLGHDSLYDPASVHSLLIQHEFRMQRCCFCNCGCTCGHAQIDLMYTQLLRGNGELVWHPNSMMRQMVLVNVSRSSNKWEGHSLLVDIDTPDEVCGAAGYGGWPALVRSSRLAR